MSMVPLLSIPAQWHQAEGWEQFPGLVHGFSSRLAVSPSRLSLLTAQATHLQTLKQVHGDAILVVERGIASSECPEADGMVTAAPGMLLGIATADCVPVLLVAPEHKVVAAVHAGWRGTLKGITIRAIELLTTHWQVEPQQLWVALGPSIGGCCYEVGREIGEPMAHRWGQTQPSAWLPRGDKGMLDLRTINAAQCEQRGVPPAQVQFVGPCTHCESDDFASYRREGANAGRQISIVGWQLAPHPASCII